MSVGVVKRLAVELANGWTVSVVDDAAPFRFSVAAFPTADPKIQRAQDRRWFDWGEGRDEVRCYDLGDVQISVDRVAASPPPVPSEAIA